MSEFITEENYKKMKNRKLIILLLLLGWYGHSIAQCDNKVSTDSNAPTNMELPDVFNAGAPYVQDDSYFDRVGASIFLDSNENS
jgi:hypothetical protein